MTRTNAGLMLIIAILASAFAAGPAAASDGYESLNAVAGSDSDPYESLSSITGSVASSPSSQGSSMNAILAESHASPVTSPSSQGSSMNAILAESPASPNGSARLSSDGYRSVSSLVGANDPVTSAVQVRASSGFDWGDALIGALVALALALMAGGATRLIAEQRRTAESGA